jgi:hypothetical protein
MYCGKINLFARVLTITAVIVAGAMAAHAATINVDWNSKWTAGHGDSSTYTGVTPVDNATSYAFNGILGTATTVGGAAFTTPALQLSDGAGGALGSTSTVTVTVGDYANDSGSLHSEKFAYDLMRDYLMADAGKGESPARDFTINGLPVGAVCDLYLYSSEAGWDDYGASFTVGGVTREASGGGATATAFVEGVNYVKYAGLAADANGQITGTWTRTVAGASDRSGDWNGLTLVTSADIIATPEPSSLVLLGVALLGMLAYAWRKRK